MSVTSITMENPSAMVSVLKAPHERTAPLSPSSLDARQQLSVQVLLSSLMPIVNTILTFQHWLHHAIAEKVQTIVNLSSSLPAAIVGLVTATAVQRVLASSLNLSKKAVWHTWNSASVRRLKKKLFYEFAVFILGTGYTTMLVLLWPGWWILGAVYCIWRCCG